VRARLDANREWTEALAEFYGAQGKLREIDGTGEPGAITERLLAALSRVAGAA
jgi:adenylate kinase family enzyme